MENRLVSASSLGRELGRGNALGGMWGKREIGVIIKGRQERTLWCCGWSVS